jgi:LacI family transcriptional regulator
MNRKPTMHDVARAAGVGTMTVSRVLNGSQHVSKLTAERVACAVAKLGYHPNEMARALRNFKSRTIGLIVPNLYDSFFATCAHSVNLVAKEHGYTVLITTSDDKAEAEYLEAQRMMQRRVEGLVVVPAGYGESRLAEPPFAAIPIVALDRPVKNSRIDSVVVENEQGASMAVEHLIEVHGHKRILFLGHKRDLYTMQLRSSGYGRAMRAAGAPGERNFTCASPEIAGTILKDVLARPDPPTAVFCANNLTTRHVLCALLRLKIRVPESLALAGFDDLELGDILHPTLTVVRQPVAEMGQNAARLLFRRLASERPLAFDASHTVVGLELMVRHSCGCVYAGDGLPGNQTADIVNLPNRVPAIHRPVKKRANASKLVTGAPNAERINL